MCIPQLEGSANSGIVRGQSTPWYTNKVMAGRCELDVFPFQCSRAMRGKDDDTTTPTPTPKTSSDASAASADASADANA